MEDDDGLADLNPRDVKSSLTSSNLCPSISKELEVSLAQTFGRTSNDTSSMPPPIPTTMPTISEKEMTTTSKRLTYQWPTSLQSSSQSDRFSTTRICHY